jgi:molybdopterin-guanine dinucleotide biosynthesis protein A
MPAPHGGAGDVLGLLLAGGRSRRMGGGDKALQPLGGKTILARVIERARPQVAALLLNANGDPARFTEYGLPVRADVASGFLGPLAGLLTGLEWAAETQPEARYLASFACDAPFFPLDLVSRLHAAAAESGADIAYAASGGRAHPVFGLWSLALAGDLRRALLEEGLRKVENWIERHRSVDVAFATAGAIDPFFNLNAPEDVAAAERFLAQRGDS